MAVYWARFGRAMGVAFAVMSVSRVGAAQPAAAGEPPTQAPSAPAPAAASTPAPSTPAPSTPAPSTPAAPAAAPPPPAPPPRPALDPEPESYAVPEGYRLVRVEELDRKLRLPLPYVDGDPVPPGFVVKERQRTGLIVAGAILTGVPWMFSVTGAVAADYEDGSAFLLVPALGPWLALLSGGASDHDCAGDDLCSNDDRRALRAVLVLDGMVQTAGAVMFVAGMTLKKKVLVKSDFSLSVTPATLGPRGYGLGAMGTF